MPFFGIKCVDEEKILTSKIEREAWEAIESLVSTLFSSEESSCSTPLLFSWKKRTEIASSREVYAWRRAIDKIKEADLTKAFSLAPAENTHASALTKSRPVMLRLAGEIASALIHSHERTHELEYVQISSTEPF